MERVSTARDVSRLHLARARLKAALQRCDRNSTGLVSEGTLRLCLSEARVDLQPIVLQEAMRRFGNGGGLLRWADLVKNLAQSHEPTARPGTASSGVGLVLRPPAQVHGPLLDRGGTIRRRGSAVSIASSASSASGFLPRPKPPTARPPTNLAVGGDNYRGITTDYQDSTVAVAQGSAAGPGGTAEGCYQVPRESLLRGSDRHGQRRPGSSASSVRSMRSAASSRPGTALSVLRRGLVAGDEQRRLEAKYNALWDAFSALDVDESEHLHVEQMRQVLEYHGSAFGIGDDDIDQLLAGAERDRSDRVNYTQFITGMIKRDMPAPRPNARGSRLRGELDHSSAARGLQRAGASRDLYELRQLLHHPRFARQRALRESLADLDPEDTGRAPRAAVLRVTMEMGIPRISRYTLHRLIDQSSYRPADETIDYNRFVLAMIRALRTAPATDAELGNNLGNGNDSNGGVNSNSSNNNNNNNKSRTDKARAKLERLRGYLALADERGLGRITPRQFAQVLAMMGLAQRQEDVSGLVTQYLDRFSGKVNVAKFVEDIERGQFSLDGATLTDGTGAADGGYIDLDQIAASAGVTVPRAKFAKPDPMLPPKRVLARPPPPSTPEFPSRFDDQDQIVTPRRHGYTKKNPLLQDEVPPGQPVRRLIQVPSDIDANHTYGVGHNHEAESMAAVLSHGYLRGHMERRRQREMAERTAKQRENKRFHTRTTKAAMEAKEKGKALAESRLDTGPMFKLSKFQHARPRVDSRR